MLLWPVHPSLNCQKPGANWPRAGSNVILSAISTRAPRSSWIASLTSQPILTPTDALAQCLEETAQNLRGRGAQAQSQPTHPATVKFYLSKYRDAIRQIDPNYLVLCPRKTRSGQHFSYLALPPMRRSARVQRAYLILVTFMLPYLIVVLRRRRFWYIPPIDNGSRNRLRAFSVEPRLRALRRISGYHRKRNFFTTRSVSKFTHSIDARYKRHRFRAAVMFYRLHELWLVDSELRLEH